MKKISQIFGLIILVLMTGCSKDAMENSEQLTGDKFSTDIGIEEQMIINFDDVFGRFEDIQEVDVLKNAPNTDSSIENNYILSEEDLLWYMELWAGYLEPIMTKDKLEELDDIEWDEKIRPYMEYDWIDDEHIDRTMASVNSWHMQLADINLDGQPEMLISEYFQDMKEDLTHIFTIQDGEVVYCGKIIASKAYKDNELFGGSDYLPSYYVDVYQNESGEFRYLSCEDWCYSSGYYQIYVSTFDGRSISDKPVFAIGYTYDEQGKMIYSYATGDWLERDNEVADDEHCAAFGRMIEEYMEGYEKADIDFTVSQYRVPAFAGELPKEQQAIVRKNIVAGFAQALGYMKEE